MRQIWVTATGPPEVLRLREAPTPAPATDQVMVEVAYAGINFADIMARLGAYAGGPRVPFVPGLEAAGIVRAVGPESGSSAAALLGRKVVALVPTGGYSEQLCVPLAQAVPIPDDMPLEVAAALPVAYLTAYQALWVMGSVRAGNYVLVLGAGGSLGLAAVELCHLLGATVLAAASPGKHQTLIDRGVRHVIDYRSADLAVAVETITGGAGADLILDPLGAAHWRRSYAMLAPTGRLVLCGNAAAVPGMGPRPLAKLGADLRVVLSLFPALRLILDNRAVLGVHLGRMWQAGERVRSWLQQLFSWWQEGRLHPYAGRMFDLADAAAAHSVIQRRENIGKVLLSAAPDLAPAEDSDCAAAL